MHSLETIIALNEKPELAQKGANIKVRDARRRTAPRAAPRDVRWLVRVTEDLVLGPYANYQEALKKHILTGGRIVRG